MEIEQIINKISVNAGKGADEIRELIKQKTDKFSGLLTDNGAAYIVAKELNVDLGLEAGDSYERNSIANLQDGMNAIDLVVIAKHIFNKQHFQKGNRKGKLCNLVVADKSGEIRLTVWNEDVKKLEEQKVEKGTTLLLKNCYVTSWQDKKQLNLGHNGEIVVEPRTTIKLPEMRANVWKLNELSKDMDNVDVYVRVVRVFDDRSFKKEGREGKVVNFEVADQTTKIRATAWNDMVRGVKKLVSGEAIKIEGAYVKEGLKGIELHLGWQARIITKPREFKIPEISQLESIEKVERKKINELGEGDALVEIMAAIVDLSKGKFYYNICPKCGKKAVAFEQDFVCNECGELKQPDINLVAGFILDDGTATIRAVGFGKQAEELLGVDKVWIKKESEKKQLEDIHQELKEKVMSKEVLVQGVARINPRSEELEFIIRRIMRLDKKSEARQTIDQL